MGLAAALRRRTITPSFLLPGQRVHDTVERLAAPLDGVLAAFMRAPEAKPPVFILGPQRSGTTIFYKCFQAHHQVCSMDQAVEHFPGAFITISLWWRLIGAQSATDFLEPYDLKKDRWIRTWKNHGYAYTEGNRVWNKLGPLGRWESPDAEAWARRTLPRMVDRLMRFTGRPVFLNKCPGNSMRIAQLLELFPDARFIHVERDPRGVINSIVNIHRALGVKAWGPMPVPKQELTGLSEYASVARQWVAITQAVERGLAALPPERKQVVRYERFMAAPDAMLNEVATAFGLESFRQPVSAQLRAERTSGWRKEIPAAEQEAILRIIEEAGLAHTLTEA